MAFESAQERIKSNSLPLLAAPNPAVLAKSLSPVAMNYEWRSKSKSKSAFRIDLSTLKRCYDGRGGRTLSAPNLSASEAFPGECEKSTTSAPRALANCTAKCPNPPMPTIPTNFPGPVPFLFKGE
jgi:hypothetical protein